MKVETLHIFPDYPNADLTVYLHTEIERVPPTPRRAMIVCPGGGYGFLSDREEEVVALAWLAEGFQSFVLHYGIGEHAQNFEPLIEACTAIRHIREHAEEYNVDPDHIFITGFSAGGHAAAAAGVLWDHEAVRAVFGSVPTRLGRPDGILPCYPVISAGEWAHRGSFVALAGPDVDAQQAFSLENFVNETTPPAFLWHTSDDGCVPVQNSLLFASALAKYHIPFELHVYPHGAHGLSLCDKRTWADNPYLVNERAAGWFDLAVRWAKELS